MYFGQFTKYSNLIYAYSKLKVRIILTSYEAHSATDTVKEYNAVSTVHFSSKYSTFCTFISCAVP